MKKKKKQLSIRKLTLSKKTVSFLDKQSAAGIVGGSDIYGYCYSVDACGGGGTGTCNTCGCTQTCATCATCPTVNFGHCSDTCNGCNRYSVYDDCNNVTWDCNGTGGCTISYTNGGGTCACPPASNPCATNPYHTPC